MTDIVAQITDVFFERMHQSADLHRAPMKVAVTKERIVFDALKRVFKAVVSRFQLS